MRTPGRRPPAREPGPGTDPAEGVRDRVCAGLTGDVLEIGHGHGHNQPHLPPEVTALWAVEPSAPALGQAAAARAGSPVPVHAVVADAQALPFPADRFDAALCTWVLCELPDPAAALAEVARVLRPGAALHLVEHGLSPDPAVRRWQRRGGRPGRLTTGCALDTDVAALLAASPLTVTALSRWRDPGSPAWAAQMYEGRAHA
ncbi:class I SAM-dependent methyltransferase [Blastococcus sp. SYSU D00695]